MSTIEIHESVNLTDNLQYLNLGFYNFVFLDKELNRVIKVPKTIAISPSKLFNIIDNNTSKINHPNGETNHIKCETNHIKCETNHIKCETNLYTKDDVIKKINLLDLTEKQKSYYVEKMLRHMELADIVNTLPTFLHFKGFIIYKNIGVHSPNKIDTKILIVEAFEYLPLLGGVDLPTNLDNMINIIKDFKKYNNLGYYHNDLQENFRNISSYADGKMRKLKVIDLDDSKKITDLICITDIKLDKLQLLFKDYISLVKGLAFHSVISTLKELVSIDYNSLFLQLTDKTNYPNGKTIEQKYEEIKIFTDTLYDKLIEKAKCF